MANPKSNSAHVPARWLHCPRKAINLVHNKFLAFKTPLSTEFDSRVEPQHRFNVDMLFSSVKSSGFNLGLWIDLTYTNRFYNKEEVESKGCKYLKLQCRGHGETPSQEQTHSFIRACQNFTPQNPRDIIGVHCTHGFNRTGFLIISFLVETKGVSVDAGLVEFAVARPPGIYKADYIHELFKRYDYEEAAPFPPAQPAWCLEYDDSEGDGGRAESTSSDCATGGEPSAKRRKNDARKEPPVFMRGVPRVKPLSDSLQIRAIQHKVQVMCGSKHSGFPGSQPVSMSRENIVLLHTEPYRVSWKADGTRYMMFIQEDGKSYFIDRDNDVFEIEGLKFPHREPPSRLLKDTLLDGEMVIDNFQGKEIPRYLAYDIVSFDGQSVRAQPFFPDRYTLLEEEVIGARLCAFQEGRLFREREPFAVRLKEFWDVTLARNLLGEKFAKQLCHEPDGLIFQPAAEPYNPGVSPKVLKWKPLSLNSVDFKLKVVMESAPGMVPGKVGELWLGGMDSVFEKIKLTKELVKLHNKIIECKWENDRWVFMRERTDKSFPNSYATAKAVCKTIRNPVTTEILLEYIHRHRFTQDDAELMPPPKERRR